MATPDLLLFYRAVYDGDLLAVKEAVTTGIDPKTTSFGIRKSFMVFLTISYAHEHKNHSGMIVFLLISVAPGSKHTAGPDEEHANGFTYIRTVLTPVVIDISIR